MTKREQLEDVVRRGDPEEWLRVLQHEATRANNAEESRGYLLSEINKWRRVMQEMDMWDAFCQAYAAIHDREPPPT